MADEHHPSLDDRLRGTLGAAADGLTIEPVPGGGFAAAGAARRRRRQGFLAAGAATALIGGIALVVVNGDDPSTIETSTSPSTSTPTTEAVIVDSAEAATSTTVPAVAAPAPLPAADEATGSIAAFTGDQLEVVPWGDGFLSIGFTYQPQPLPELSDDIKALFPPEVLAVFPDGLPATIEEATAALQDADLIDEVSAVLAEHPEAGEAVFGQASPPPELHAEFTTDGVEWTPVALDLPEMQNPQFTVGGGRLVVWGVDQSPGYDVSATPQDRSTSRTVTVSSTSDLESWQTTTAQVPLPSDDRAYVVHDIWVGTVAVTTDRWIATVEQSSWVNWQSLLPADVNEQMQMDGGWSTTSDGIEVHIGDASGTTTTLYTWADLGLDGNPEENFEYSDTTLLGGGFDGTAEMLELPAAYAHGTVSSLGDRFLVSGAQAGTSVDGVVWEPLTGIPENIYVSATAPVSGGYLIVGEDGSDGQRAWLRAADGSLSEVTLPTLSDADQYYLWGNPSSATWIVEPSPPYVDDWEPVTITVEYEGYRIALTDGPDGSSYVLSDAATGAEIQTAVVDNNDDSYWEFDQANQRSFIVIRDETTGEPIVRIPEEVLTQAWDDQFTQDSGSSGPADTVTTDETPAIADEVWVPNLWLVATVDGVNWITRDLIDDGADPDGAFWPQASAINGNRLIYQTADGWIIETI